MNKKIWTEADIQYIREHKDEPKREIAKALGRTVCAVEKRLYSEFGGSGTRKRRAIKKQTCEPIKSKKTNLEKISEINKKARAEGVSYGKYVAKYGIE